MKRKKIKNYTVYTILSGKSLKILYSIKNSTFNSNDVVQHVLLYTRMFVFHMTFIVSPTRAHVRSHTKVQFFALKIISEIMRDAEFQVFITQRQNNHLHALNVKLTRQFVIVEDKQEGVSLWFPNFKKRHDILF